MPFPRLLRALVLHGRRNHDIRPPSSQGGTDEQTEQPLPRAIEQLKAQIQADWEPCPDLRFRTFSATEAPALLVWIQGLVQAERLDRSILGPLSDPHRRERIRVEDSDIPGGSIEPVHTLSELYNALCEGKVILAQEGRAASAVAVDISQVPGRPLAKPEKEPTLHGPQEALVENLEINIALVRKRLRTPRLKVELRRLGRRSHTKVAILYADGIVKPALVKEARQRLDRIVVDALQDINELHELIADAPLTLYPTVEETERPERICTALLQGRVGIMMDGSPACMLVPVTFPGLLASPEDYYLQYTLALPLRIMRHLLFWVSTLLPGLYVAVLSYNQDLVPTPLLISVAAQHLGIPFPSVVEALFMMAAFEALREAGTRLPRAVGQSVSIVGTLLIGDAAVRAGLVSPGMVIIVAGTGVASFAIPTLGLVNACRITQFLFVLSAALFGLYGIVLLGMVLVGHLTSIRSFGVPYLSPLAPFVWTDMKDALIRAPWWAMRTRPRQYEPLDIVRARSTYPGKPGRSG
ncbi:MAG: spore germination protein [Alicyclobacillus sp.]|nr:spore germination protein [Alicyclobacillus sp.]